MDAINLKLDKNYNIQVKQPDTYADDLSEVVDLLQKVSEEKILTDREISFVLNIALRKNIQKDLGTMLHNFYSVQQPSTQTMFVQLKTHKFKNAT